MTPYQTALSKLLKKAKKAVEAAITAWSKKPNLNRVAENITDETALDTGVFASLLEAFAVSLDAGKESVDSWQIACRPRKLKGHRIANDQCPAILGRVRKLEDHAVAVARASRGRGDLTEGQVVKLLLKYAGARAPSGLESFLKEAPLGNLYVWATFDPDDPSANPFDRLPKSHAGIRTALGLGHFMEDDTLILLVWSHVNSGAVALHRPTVADAEDNPFYKPRPDENATYGLTQPLSPNPDALEAQPEVVSPQASAKGLVLPFLVLQA